MSHQDIVFEEAYEDLRKIEDVVRRYRDALSKRGDEAAASKALKEIATILDLEPAE